MSQDRDWPCWEIMKCNPENAKQCPAYNSARPCWEVMQKIDSYSFNICRDCIVYVIKQKDPIFSREEIRNIMIQKGVGVQEMPCARLRGSEKSTFLENN